MNVLYNPAHNCPDTFLQNFQLGPHWSLSRYGLSSPSGSKAKLCSPTTSRFTAPMSLGCLHALLFLPKVTLIFFLPKVPRLTRLSAVKNPGQLLLDDFLTAAADLSHWDWLVVLSRWAVLNVTALLLDFLHLFSRFYSCLCSFEIRQLFSTRMQGWRFDSDDILTDSDDKCVLPHHGWVEWFSSRLS